jgi:hypothetical protein
MVLGASGPLIRVCGVSMDVSFQGGSNETIGGRARLRRPELSLILLKLFWWPPGPLIRMFGVSMDASFHGGSNDTNTIGGHVRCWRPEIPPFLMAAALSALTYVITCKCTHNFGGRGVIRSCRLLTAAALSSRSYVIRIVFCLPMSPSLVC